ncbi:MAG: hypothetical protein ACK5KT_05645 [Dysgonomonas sp.]
MKKISKTYYSLFVALIVVGSMLACNSNKKQQITEEKDNLETAAYDSTKIQIDVAKIDTMTLIFTDDESRRIINEDGIKILADNMTTARYDTAWNDKDIMINMIAPDYTLIIQHKGESPENNDWLMIWKNDGRTKYKNKWFFIADDKRESIYQLLESYRNPENKN